MTSTKPIIRQLLADKRFVAVAIIVAVAAVGWGLAMDTLEWAMHSEPVPWPEGVTVDNHFRLSSLPAVIGPYHLIDGDKGDTVLPNDILEGLKLGTPLDKSRRGDRTSGWYSARIYEDTSHEGPLRYWRLEVYFYNGLREKVPHVPDRCVLAAGGAITGSTAVTFNFPSLSPPWQGDIRFHRTMSELPDTSGLMPTREATYYAFSLNGEPESSWETVRLKLNRPWVRRCYFAKIQFAPATPRGISGMEREVEAAAERFMQAVLPELLKTLPTASDIEALSATSER